MFSIPDFVQPNYVDQMTAAERYGEEEEDPIIVEPWAVYDPD